VITADIANIILGFGTLVLTFLMVVIMILQKK